MAYNRLNERHAFIRTQFEEEIYNAGRTSKRAYVFPWDQKTKEYDISSYDPGLSDVLVTPSYMQIIMAALRESRYYHPTIRSKAIYYLGWIVAVSMSITGTILMAENREHEEWLYIAVPFFWIIGILSLVSFIKWYIYCPLEKRAEELRLVIASLEDSLLTGKGIHLELSALGGVITMIFLHKKDKGLISNMVEGVKKIFTKKQPEKQDNTPSMGFNYPQDTENNTIMNPQPESNLAKPQLAPSVPSPHPYRPPNV